MRVTPVVAGVGIGSRRRDALNLMPEILRVGYVRVPSPGNRVTDTTGRSEGERTNQRP